jgi:hypothetical protein
MAKVEAGLFLPIALPKYQRKGVAERFLKKRFCATPLCLGYKEKVLNY